MTDGQEHRRSFRVSESVYIKYEVLSEDEFQDGLEHRRPDWVKVTALRPRWSTSRPG